MTSATVSLTSQEIHQFLWLRDLHMTKLRFTYLLAFAALLVFVSMADAQEASIVGAVEPVMAASSVVEPAPFVQPAPAYQSTPAVSSGGCSSCAQSGAITPASQIAGPACKSCSGCCLPAPTVAAGIPQLPIASCCGNTGRLNIPPLTTPLRYDTPPVGRSVGRPLFGPWTGY